MRTILPEICWKEVENWEIEWVEMRAKLLQQPQIDPETSKSQSEQEVTIVSVEIQPEIDKDQEIKHKTINQQFSKDDLEEDPVSTHHFIFDRGRRFLPDAETRQDDWNAPEVDAARESTGKSAHRPPPKPPNFTSDGGDELRSLTHEIDGTTLGDGDEGITASNSAENSTVAKGRKDNDAADQNHGDCASEPAEHRTAPRSELQRRETGKSGQ
ncbi:hypothetical protein PIB30_080997 [Stylosanthes scabra]|uniref:Uncharacterized protein n=1 Tax=Stylosanthes scabra TaxID=79078 RepID=A0ABU6XU51_9FABA|nr:hypothetical protein [Stylosanthes scabra]